MAAVMMMRGGLLAREYVPKVYKLGMPEGEVGMMGYMSNSSLTMLGRPS